MDRHLSNMCWDLPICHPSQISTDLGGSRRPRCPRLAVSHVRLPLTPRPVPRWRSAVRKMPDCTPLVSAIRQREDAMTSRD